MRVLGRRLLIEQITIKKESKVIMPGALKDDPSLFTHSYKVLQVGDECPEGKIFVGEVPVLAKYVDISGLKMIEKTDTKMVSHVIVPYDDVIAID